MDPMTIMMAVGAAAQMGQQLAGLFTQRRDKKQEAQAAQNEQRKSENMMRRQELAVGGRSPFQDTGMGFSTVNTLLAPAPAPLQAPPSGAPMMQPAPQAPPTPGGMQLQPPQAPPLQMPNQAPAPRPPQAPAFNLQMPTLGGRYGGR